MSHEKSFEEAARDEERHERGRKERVLHTRISESLAEDLRRVADDLRVPVSNLVRNVLEEAFSVVETVTGNVGELIEEVMDEAEAVRDRIQSRQRRRSRGPRRAAAPEEPADQAAAASTPPRDDEVIGWQPLVLARPQRCESCGTLMGRGDSAYASVTPKGVGASWRCEDCPID
ncbi:MAG TPA: hypothetical protein VNF72_12920 [Myxococcota bacterium]|nr:hypothetical protein [Myxococcota bacterium]